MLCDQAIRDRGMPCERPRSASQRANKIKITKQRVKLSGSGIAIVVEDAAEAVADAGTITPNPFFHTK